MSQQCTVCNHPELKSIEKQIVEGRPHTRIASKYDDLNNQAIRRHALNHLPRRMVLAQRREQREHTADILDHLDGIINDTKNILDEALEGGEKTTALRAIKEARNNMEFLAKIQVKKREFQKDEEERQGKIAQQTISKGLESLTTEELKTLQFLQAKVYSADDNYVPDHTAQSVIDYVNDHSSLPHTSTDIDAETISRSNTTNKKGSDDEPRLSSDKQQSHDNSGSDRRRNRSEEVKSAKNEQEFADEDEKDDVEWEDDLELDDLNLEDLDDNQIPDGSEEPDWLKEERRKRRRYNR